MAGITLYVAPVSLEMLGILCVLPSIYLVIYVMYKLFTWMKSLRICKKRNSGRLRLKSQEPDRLANPNEYEHDERLKLLPPPDQEDECPRNFDTETYPTCGNSQQNYGSVNNLCLTFTFLVCIATLSDVILKCDGATTDDDIATLHTVL